MTTDYHATGKTHCTSPYKLLGHNSQLITWWRTSCCHEVERGCEEEGVPRKIFATSEAILETSSELSIEADGVVFRLVSLEEGPG